MSIPEAEISVPVAASESATVVAAQDVTRRYGEGDAAVDALRGITVDFPRGQFTAVMGPSGSGKSTLMHILAGLDTPTTGSVEIDGVEITRMKDKQLTLMRREKIGFIFQSFNLLPMLTAEENIDLPLTIAGRNPEGSWKESLLKAVGLDTRRKHKPSELSGGQQQRVAIARALAGSPRLLLADEPTGNLDSQMARGVMELLEELNAEGTTILMVTHDPELAARAQRNVHIIDGQVTDISHGPVLSAVAASLASQPV